MTLAKNSRIELVDALRGFAVFCIVVLHNMEHFEFIYKPEIFPEWLIILDEKAMFLGYFLFGGKAYAIFALLFGFSFYIQNENQKQKGNDFRGRFFWRMCLLLIFGYINTAFYQGDILTLYAILGLTLIPVCNLKSKTIFVIATVLMLQPLEWAKIIYALANTSFSFAPNASNAYNESIAEYMNNGNFVDYVVGNVTLGKTASLLWSWEYGRFFQAPALFMFGLLAGRQELFAKTESNFRFWKKALIYGIFSFAILYTFIVFLPDFSIRKTILERLLVVFNSWANIGLMTFWVAGFVLLFYSLKPNNILENLIPVGKMSLTTYIMQSMIGSTLYYKYGFGFYEITGPTVCIFIGIVLFILQILFCKWWLKTHSQGSLEHIWHKLTWMKF